MKRFFYGLLASRLFYGNISPARSDSMDWADGSGDIRRANLDGSDQQILVTRQNLPQGLALDLAGGQMYWTDNPLGTGDIRRANLDGTDQQTLISGLNGPA